MSSNNKDTPSRKKNKKPIFIGTGIPIDSKKTRQINRRKCPHCQEHPYKRALVPCGHLLCDLCILEFKKGDPCPLCQSKIIGKL